MCSRRYIVSGLLIAAILYEWPVVSSRFPNGWVLHTLALQNVWLRRAMIAEDYTQIRLALLCGADGGYYNDHDAETPLNHAIRHRDLWMMHWILFRGGSVNPGGFTPLREALNTGDPRVVRLLLQRGARADDEEFDGSTPLMNAASYPDRRIATIMCRLLFQYGARRAPRIRFSPVDGYAGKSAADLAAAQGHTALAEELRPLPGRR